MGGKGNSPGQMECFENNLRVFGFLDATNLIEIMPFVFHDI